MTVFLSLEEVLYLHANQIELYGGDPGLRDLDLLNSAVAQPEATFEGEYLHSYPYEMAAAYLFHLVENHPFVDGNKRTGAVAALVFLDLNDIEFNAQDGDLFETTMEVASGQMNKGKLAAFFRSCAS